MRGDMHGLLPPERLSKRSVDRAAASAANKHEERQDCHQGQQRVDSNPAGERHCKQNKGKGYEHLKTSFHSRYTRQT